MRAAFEWLRRPVVMDPLLAVLLLVVAVSTPMGSDEDIPDLPGWMRVVAAIGMTAPFAWRRRAPVTVLLVAILCSALASTWAFIVALPLALYSAVAYSRKRWQVLVIGAVVAAATAVSVAGLVIEEETVAPAVMTGIFAIFVAPAWLGAAVRALRERRAELELREAQLRAARDDNVRRAVFEEQVRLARELHDVVTHHVSMIGVRAAAARRDLASNPDDALRELAGIEESSRRAVTELYAMLGHLRRSDEPVASLPQPGVAQLGELVAQLRRVELEVVGEPRPLSRPVDVSVYRIVQEALTNTVKHAGGAAVRVVLHHRPDSVEVTVRDDGAASARPVGVGYGLIGMRERVALHGGQLEAGPLDDGGFRVHATLPTGSGDRLVQAAGGALRRQGQIDEVPHGDVVDTG